MKRLMVFWTFVVFLTLQFMPVAFSFELTGYSLGGPAVFYLNPSDLPEHYAEDNPRIIDLAGSPELQQEERIKILEEDLRAYYHELSSVPESTLVVRYGGRTEVGCYDAVPTFMHIICIIDNPEFFTLPDGRMAWGLASFGAINSVVVEGRIYLNAKYTRKPRLGSLLLHETGHIIGLDHEDDVPALMNSIIFTSLESPYLHPDDIAGVRHIYPFTEDCAPVADVKGGRAGFVIDLYFEGNVLQVRLDHFEGNNLGFFGGTVISVNPVLERSCVLKLDENDSLRIPYIAVPDKELEVILYKVELKLNREKMVLDLIELERVS